MRILIFSDIHGNLPALEKLLREESDIDQYINVGDVVNYGPWSNECVELVDNLPNCSNIVGNHEEYFINNYCDVKSTLVQDFFNICVQDFKYRDIISKYKVDMYAYGYKIRHTLGKKDYIFHDSEVEIFENTILGHSHQQFEREINGHKLINPGSVGQNRKFINVSNYIIWNPNIEHFELKSFKYDLDILLNEMKSRSYPADCINYYKNKNIAN